MRIARVLPASSLAPIAALEVGDVLYDVGELDRYLETSLGPDHLSGASDFQTRVLSLGCAGLDRLEHALDKEKRRPRDARLLEGSFVWLPPCETERAIWVQLGAYGAAPRPEPEYALCNARALVGHEATVAFPPDEHEPDVELSVAAVLRDELFRATPDAARASILGYSILAVWVAREQERRGGSACARSRDFAAQLGPVVVTAESLPDLASACGSIEVGGRRFVTSPVGRWPFELAQSIAFVSQHVALRPGDLIGAGRLEGGCASAHGVKLEYGAPVKLGIDGIGTLTGRPVLGPAPPAWRSSAG